MENIYGETPLHEAIVFVNNGIVLNLIKGEMEVNAINNYGETALNIALELNDFDVAELIQSGFLDRTRVGMGKTF